MTTFWDLNAALTAAALKTVESADIEELAEIPPSRIKREYAREIRGALGGGKCCSTPSSPWKWRTW